ncbi:Alpha-protein kinase vwkA [Madurella mycetomatis]|uniref:Alpha-protein kinase vwkA n=1 Tax=Madurella mycetomatis TaxID=100816 RepID=A0A175WBY2_9PEZI|nr:Alpha-protein kinase vwkA [Madurella mycetomatis]
MPCGVKVRVPSTASASGTIEVVEPFQNTAVVNLVGLRKGYLFKAICSTDLLFLIDTTGSMGDYIDAAKDQIRSIVRDIGTAFLNGVEVHGRSRALHANWQHRTRCIIHIANAPPHGRTLHDWADSYDSYANPGSEPHRLEYRGLIERMVRLDINYALLRINNSTNRMAYTFLQTYAAASADCSSLQINMYHSIILKVNAATSGLLFQEAKLGISFSALQHLVTWIVTASTSRTATHHAPRMSKDAVVHSANTLNYMMASDENITMSELELTICKRQHPSNLGEEGFKFFFASHECNAICRKLELKTNVAMITSGRHEFRETWPSLADSVCYSNMLCGRILICADDNESIKYLQCHWCDTCWPQLEQYTEELICTVQTPRRHEFEVSRFFHES